MIEAYDKKQGVEQTVKDPSQHVQRIQLVI